MNKHTSGPWICGDYSGYISSENMGYVPLVTPFLVEANRDNQNGPTPEAQANAARIVACVNACEGIKDPEEMVPEMMNFIHELTEVDEGSTIDYVLEGWVIAARALLAKLTPDEEG